MAQHLLVIILAVSNFLGFYCQTASYQTFDVLRNSKIFVDKTFLISKFLTGPTRNILITAPPGFGKTTNLDMIRQYAEIDIFPNGTMKTDPQSHKNYRTFADVVPSTGKYLAAFRHKKTFKKHFGQYPVIWLDLDLKGVKTYDKLSFMRYLLNGTIREAFEHHAYILNSPEISSVDKELFKDFMHLNCSAHDHVIRGCSPRFGIGLLKKLLKKHFRKDSIVLMDNCDAPIRGIILNPRQENNEAIGILYELTNILEAIPHSDFGAEAESAHRCFIAGILKPFYETYSTYNIQSYRHIHGLSVTNIGNPFGFFPEEMKMLLLSKNVKFEIKQLKQWYGGFKDVLSYNDSGSIFNPQSVRSFLSSNMNELKAYWAELGSLSTFEPAFLPECFGHHVVECFCEDGSKTQRTNNPYEMTLERWIKAQETLRDLQKLPILPSQCTDLARHYFMMYLGRLGYLNWDFGYTSIHYTPTHTFNIPNLEVGNYVKKLLYNTIVTKTPLNGDTQFRVELFDAILDVDESETSMRRFAEALVTLLVASEHKQTHVDNATLAHFIRVHLLCTPSRIKVNYMKASFSKEEKEHWRHDPRSELVFAIEGKKGILEFDVKFKLGGNFGTANQTVKGVSSNNFTSELQNNTSRPTAKVTANLICGKNVCNFSYFYNSKNLQKENSVKIEKDTILKTAKARWTSF